MEGMDGGLCWVRLVLVIGGRGLGGVTLEDGGRGTQAREPVDEEAVTTVKESAVKAACYRGISQSEESDVEGIIIRRIIRCSGTCTVYQFHRIKGFKLIKKDDNVLFDSESFRIINSIHPSLIDKLSSFGVTVVHAPCQSSQKAVFDNDHGYFPTKICR